MQDLQTSFVSNSEWMGLSAQRDYYTVQRVQYSILLSQSGFSVSLPLWTCLSSIVMYLRLEGR